MIRKEMAKRMNDVYWRWIKSCQHFAWRLGEECWCYKGAVPFAPSIEAANALPNGHCNGVLIVWVFVFPFKCEQDEDRMRVIWWRRWMLSEMNERKEDERRNRDKNINKNNIAHSWHEHEVRPLKCTEKRRRWKLVRQEQAYWNLKMVDHID